MYILTQDLYFPPLTQAYDDGLLALGGDLSVARLLLAYRSGIFPWYNDGEAIQWYSPNPRFVLHVPELKVHKSMKTMLRNPAYTSTINRAFEQVIHNCAHTSRALQHGTWITSAMKQAYTQLHHTGHAISAEAWYHGELVGGLYGVLVGKVFCGESMYCTMANASKLAFIHMVAHLQSIGVMLIDCQVHTTHLESLGARYITRDAFIKYLQL